MRCGVSGMNGFGNRLLMKRPDELVRIDYSGVGHHRHGLDISRFLHEGADVGIGNLGRDEVVAQQTAEDGHGGMEWIEACRDLHRLHLIDDIA